MDYKTIKEPAFNDFTEQKSRFIGHIAPVTDDKSAMEFISGIKSRHRDATHNVYAYILRDGQTRRCSDDGEPSGTAGVPVLDVLMKEGLVDTAVVVTRYFGGVLLGAGGLVRAYSHCAKLAVDAAKVMLMTECWLLRLELAYSWYGAVQRLLPTYNAQVQDCDFGAEIHLDVLVRADRAELFANVITELSAATVSVTKMDVSYADLK